MWEAKNKVTGRIYGPYTDEQKAAMEARPQTRRKYEWTEIVYQELAPPAPSPAGVKKNKKEAETPTQDNADA